MAPAETYPRINGITEYAATPSPNNGYSKAKFDIPPDYLLPDGNPDYLRLILTSRVYEVIKETPLTYATNLSSRLKCKVLLKREDLQPVFSFKIRGAHNKIAHLSDEERKKGVVACSAGNHAQGVALSAKSLGIPATIVMPMGTPAIKHINVARLGSKVVLHGQDFDAAKEECKRLELEQGLTNISPFDDPYVIAGQGTIGMELVRQCNLRELKAVFCCIGGGGLIAGISVYLKRIAPHVKVIGVETYDANAMHQSLEQGDRVTLKDVGLFADGAAVKLVGEETYRLCRENVDEVLQVSTDEICAAIKDVFEDTRAIVEPAGALALAGLKKYIGTRQTEETDAYTAVLSGANMNFDRLRFVADRAQLGERKEALLSVIIPEKPGSFLTMIEFVLPHTVTEFTYRMNHKDRAHIFMTIQVKDRDEDLPQILKNLNDNGMEVEDISDNEFAKTHARFFVSGKPVENEKLYAFEFPERPGALAKFLRTMRPSYNISTFHYRNYGSDVAHILAGIQVPQEDSGTFSTFLKELGYPFREETDNPPNSQFAKLSGKKLFNYRYRPGDETIGNLYDDLYVACRKSKPSAIMVRA
ncbi:threonine deaminase [Orbilia oligospora]|uniref:Threonine dehydratase n=1 Tax=Orbilia oligospora TaxID=2813651 RepID=A0A6G1MAM7_ORBOL|nr:threonine deaminase [Orbilia oligospora]KAF3219182.1 threonine deaminase [Orbilia oligospora]KAF3251841.1 threonine deaminase [Orbilia oligospora]